MVSSGDVGKPLESTSELRQGTMSFQRRSDQLKCTDTNDFEFTQHDSSRVLHLDSFLKLRLPSDMSITNVSRVLHVLECSLIQPSYDA